MPLQNILVNEPASQPASQRGAEYIYTTVFYTNISMWIDGNYGISAIIFFFFLYI